MTTRLSHRIAAFAFAATVTLAIFSGVAQLGAAQDAASRLARSPAAAPCVCQA